LKESGEWLKLFLKSYEKLHQKKLVIPRWREIEDTYITKEEKKNNKKLLYKGVDCPAIN